MQTYPPLDELPAPNEMPDGTKMAEIQQAGRLIVGVSGDTLLFGSRNPLSGDIEGFDIEVLKEVARAIFGEGGEDKIVYKVITYAQRLPALEARDVDIVAHTMTINCNRWLRINFSSVYYQAGQKVLVKTGSGFESIEDLADAEARVCAPEGSTNIDEILDPDEPAYEGIVVVPKPDITDCLVAMQQGLAEATTGDDTVLAGFAAQDPSTELVGDAFTEEPYGLGMNRDDVDLVQFVNAVTRRGAHRRHARRDRPAVAGGNRRARRRRRPTGTGARLHQGASVSGRRGVKESLPAVLAQWDDWLSTATDRLMSLDERVIAAGDGLPDPAQAQLDMAAAFLCRKAIGARIDEIRADPSQAVVLSARIVTDDRGAEVAGDLTTAASLLGGVLDRVERIVAAAEAAHHGLATDRTSASADLAIAERLARDLGHYVQRAAAARTRADAAGGSSTEWRGIAVEAAALRTELERIDAARRTSFERWRALPAEFEALRAREAEVRELVGNVRSKVSPVPVLAVPSVDALAAVRPVEELEAMPWPAARAAMEPLLLRVDRLESAFDEIASRYGSVLERRNELRGLLHAFRDKAGGSGLAEDAALEPLLRDAEQQLWSAPCDVEAAAVLVQQYTDAVNAAIAARTDTSTRNRHVRDARGGTR